MTISPIARYVGTDWRGKGMKNMNFPGLEYEFLGLCPSGFVRRGAVKMRVLV